MKTPPDQLPRPDLVLAALKDEAKYVRHPVCVTGMGWRRLCDAIDRARPTSVLLIGFAAGLSPDCRAGTVLRVGRVLHAQDPPIELNGTCSLLTVDELVDRPAAKRRLHETTCARLADMETYFVARHCRQRDIRLDVIRAVSDPADAGLPPESVDWVKPDGTRDLAAAMRHLLTHPRHVPAMIRLGRASNKAARGLAATLSQCLVV